MIYWEGYGKDPLKIFILLDNCRIKTIKPDQMGSLSTIVNKELDCTRNLFRIRSFEFYFGSMGTNFVQLRKKVSANDQGWKN